MADDPDDRSDENANAPEDDRPESESGQPEEHSESSVGSEDSETRADPGPADSRMSDPSSTPEEGSRSGRVESTSTLRHSGPEPHVSLTIEGQYESVFERVEHPKSPQYREVDRIVENLENTLLAVNGTGGGIRSEIYDAAEFELNDPWEIRKYLELLEMHDLIRMQDDRWVPLDHSEQTTSNDESR